MKRLARIILCFLGVLALGEGADLAWLSHSRATINAALTSTTVAGNGSTTVFTFPFIGVAPADVTVIYTDTSGNQTTLVQNTQYSITINAPTTGSIWGIGGTVTYPLIGSPITAGTTLTIYRSLPLQQTVSSNNGQAFPLAVETALDLLDMQIQQVNNLFSRAIVQPISDSCTLSPMPGQIQRANQLLGFDGTGCNPTAVSALPSGTVSSAMQPVVDAASLAAGRTAFGLGSSAVENIGSYGLADDGSGNLRQSYAVTSDSTNQSVTAAFHLTQHVAGANITYTLPRANTLWNGFGFWVIVPAAVGTATVTPNGSDSFSGQSPGVSINVQSGTAVFISTNAASSGVWYIGGAAGRSITSTALNVRAFGAVADDTTDDAPAVNRALAALPSEGGAIFFPPGKYKLNSEIDFTIPTGLSSLTILCAAPETSILHWPNSNGFVITYSDVVHNSVHVDGCSLTTGVAGTYNGINLSYTGSVPTQLATPNTFHNIMWRGDDGYNVTDYWANGFASSNVSDINFDSVTINGPANGASGYSTHGTGINIAATSIATVFNISSSWFNFLNIGVVYGNKIQGLTVNQSNFTGGNIGIDVPVSETAITQLAVSNSQFNVASFGIADASGVTGSVFVNNDFIIPEATGGVGMSLIGSVTDSITGNTFGCFPSNAAGVGVALAGSLYTLTGNAFVGCNTGLDIKPAGTVVGVVGNLFEGNATGITAESGATFVNVQSNVYANNTAKHSPSSTTGSVVFGGGSD